MTQVHGVEVTSAAEVAALVESQLAGTGPWGDKQDYTAIDGLKRAIAEAGGLAPAFGAALVALLGRAELPLRAGAIAALPAAAGHVSGDAVVAAYDADPTRFVGVPMPAGYPTMGDDLEAALVMAMSQAGVHGGARVAAFYQAHLEGPSAVWALLGLAVAAPDWVVAHAARVVPRRMLVGVLGKLPDHARRSAVVRALAPWGAEGRTVTASPGWRLLKLAPDEKAALEALLHAD